MPAGAFTPYTTALRDIARGLIDLDNDTIVAILVDSDYSPLPNADDTYSDLGGNELATGNGYTNGGQVVSPLTVTAATNVVTVDTPTNPSWTAVGALTAKYIVLVKRAGASLAAGDLLIGYSDLNIGAGSVTATDSPLTVTWNASGLFTYTRP